MKTRKIAEAALEALGQHIADEIPPASALVREFRELLQYLEGPPATEQLEERLRDLEAKVSLALARK